MTEPAQNRAELSANTAKGYAADWRHFARWCRLTGAQPLPPSPDLVAAYLGALGPVSAATIDRRLSGLVWNAAQRGFTLDRRAPQISAAIASRADTGAPTPKAAIGPADIRAMVATLPYDLRGLRDRAMLLLGYAAGLRRSQLTGLDRHRGDTPDGTGWIRVEADGLLLSLTTRTGLRVIHIPRGPVPQTCPVRALEQWLDFAKIDSGPIFTRTSRDGKRALTARLNDRHVARLIKRCVLDAGLRPDLPQAARLALFSTESLRGGQTER